MDRVMGRIELANGKNRVHVTFRDKHSLLTVKNMMDKVEDKDKGETLLLPPHIS